MSTRGRSDQAQATLSVLGILAIPLVTVSSAALLAGPVSSTDPIQFATTTAATLIGAATGLTIVHLVRIAVVGVHLAAKAAIGWIDVESVPVTIAAEIRCVATQERIAPTSHHIGAITLRGPPLGL